MVKKILEKETFGYIGHLRYSKAIIKKHRNLKPNGGILYSVCHEEFYQQESEANKAYKKAVEKEQLKRNEKQLLFRCDKCFKVFLNADGEKKTSCPKCNR